MSSSKPPTSRSESGRSESGSVPAAVVNRLSLYLRELQHLVAEGIQTTSSSQLGERLGFSDAQVRKDLAHFGNFGHPGIGYRCDELISEIRRILGTDRVWTVALVGVGNLGRALLGYRGFESQGFRVAAAFDSDPAKVGSHVEGIEIRPIEEISQVVAKRRSTWGWSPCRRRSPKRRPTCWWPRACGGS